MNIGNKAKNIKILEKNNICIPKTFIIENIKSKNLKFNLLNNKTEYILRPSFEIEDQNKFSFAGFFNSIFPIKKENIRKILSLKNIENLFNGKNYKLKSIIIQEFIKTNIYGVYFTRNPNNIFKKGYYDIGKTNFEITSGKGKNNLKLNSFQKKELEIIGKKIEKIFNYPQDIEFCIKNNKFIILQTRNITTGNETIYNFNEIKNINGIYRFLDFDELGNKQDFFSYKVLKKLFNILYINEKIYFKDQFLGFSFKKINTKNKNLRLFYKNYQKYLTYKFLFTILKIFLYQKLNKNVLKIFFRNYNYSFLLNEKSYLDLPFDFQTNLKTKLFLKIEKIKYTSFIFLEKYKKEFQNNKNIIEKINDTLPNKIIFYKGIIQNKIIENNNFKWIYKGKISGKIVNLENFKYKKNLKQILILENLNIHIYDKLNFIDGIVIKNGNSLSHNSIILREYKVPSIIQYKNFENLIIGEEINL